MTAEAAGRRPWRALGPVCVALLAAAALAGCASGVDAQRLRSSGDPVVAEDLAGPFATKTPAVDAKIEKAAQLSTAEWRAGADRRRPFELAPAQGCGPARAGERGFLLVHGFTDSPYLLRDVAEALRRQEPCATIRAVVLPGHATVPGDLIDVRHEDWVAAAGGAIAQMSGEVRRLYLVGFSTGAALVLNDVAAHGPRNIGGLVLISPLVRVEGGPTWLLRPMSRMKTWDMGNGLRGLLTPGGAYPDDDPVKYQSTPYRAEAEVVALTKELAGAVEARPRLDVPVFVAQAARDATVSAADTLRLFCAAAPEGRRHILWYADSRTAADDQLAPLLKDDEACRRDVEVRTLLMAGAADNIHDFSHVGLPVRPDNPVYGEDGSYRNCAYYYPTSPTAYEVCKTRVKDQVVLGENSDPNMSLPIQRLTFNPDFDVMMTRITAFLARVGAAPPG